MRSTLFPSDPGVQERFAPLTPPTRALEVPGIDVIRFAAALMVAVLHLGFAIWQEPPNQNVAGLKYKSDLAAAGEWMGTGWVGVEIFFVISGFVIAGSSAGKSVGGFLFNRFVRLYPGAIICATATFVIAFAASTAQVSNWLRSVVLWPTGPWIDYVYWTLGVELSFYALIAVSIVGRLSLRSVGLFLCCLGSIFWFARVADFLTGSHFAFVFRSFENQAMKLLLASYASYFGLGIMLWSATQRRWRGRDALAAVAAVGSGVVGILAYSRSFQIERGQGLVSLLAPSLIWLVALIAIVVAVRSAQRRADRPHSASWLRWLGLMTYPLYLLHHEIGQRIMQSYYWEDGRIAALSALALVVALSAVVTCVERPIAKTLRTLRRN